MSKADWRRVLFDQKYLDTYLADFTAERTSQEVDFVVKAARLIPQDRILDLACGQGRHSIELAKRGFTVVGLDYSEPFIEKAKADAKEAEVNVEFVQGDMRQFPYKGEFDVVLMLFTDFGYFDDKTNQKVIEGIFRSLKPGGRFLIDVISGEAYSRRFTRDGIKVTGTNLLKIPRTAVMGGKQVDEIEWYDPEKQLIHTHREWMDNEKKREHDYYLRIYTAQQYRDMLSKENLKVKGLWGDFYGNPHDTNGNFRTIILAEK